VGPTSESHLERREVKDARGNLFASYVKRLGWPCSPAHDDFAFFISHEKLENTRARVQRYRKYLFLGTFRCTRTCTRWFLTACTRAGLSCYQRKTFRELCEEAGL